MSSFNPKKFNPDEKLVVVLRNSGVDLSRESSKTALKKYDAMWFTVKYIECWGTIFEFLAAETDEHGYIHVVDGDFALIGKGRPRRRYAYLEVLSVDKAIERGYPLSLRIKTPQR